MAAKTAAVTVNIVANAAKAAAGFKEAGDAGEAFANSINKAADKVESDLANTAKIAERLSKELGSGFKTVAGQGIQDLATQINRAGLTLDDLEGNVDSIIGGLRRLESQADDTAKATQHIGDKADDSRNVMANFVGNSVQEIPGLTDAFGPLNTAIGQFAEKAVEGNLTMAGLGAAVGPMALVGGAIAGVSFLIGKLGEASKKAAEQAKKIEEAYYAWKKGDIEGTVKDLYEANKVLFDDIPENIVSADKLAAAIAGNKPAFDEVIAAMQKARAEVDLNNNNFYHEQLNWDNRIELLQRTRDEWLKTNDEATQYDSITALIAKHLPSNNEIMKKNNDLIDQQGRYLSFLNDEWDQYWNSLDQERLAWDTWASFGDANIALEDRVQLIGQYVQEVLKMPPGVMDRFRLELSQGDIDGAQRYLEILQGIADAGYGGYQSPSRGGGSYIPQQKNALGTMSAQRGLSLVGERGPELIALGGGERIYNAQQTAGMMGGTFNVSVYPPAGADGDSIVRALQRWVQTNGALPVATTTAVIR